MIYQLGLAVFLGYLGLNVGTIVTGQPPTGVAGTISAIAVIVDHAHQPSNCTVIACEGR